MDYLNSKCFDKICRNVDCSEAVKLSPMGSWYITMGHAGFNSPANNRMGYITKENALKAMKYYLSKRG